MCPLTGRARPSHTARASSRPCPGAAAGLPELLTSAPPINFALSSRHDAAAEGCEAPSPAVSGWRQRGGDPHRPSRSGTAIADPARPSARPLGAGCRAGGGCRGARRPQRPPSPAPRRAPRGRPPPGGTKIRAYRQPRSPSRLQSRRRGAHRRGLLLRIPPSQLSAVAARLSPCAPAASSDLISKLPPPPVRAGDSAKLPSSMQLPEPSRCLGPSPGRPDPAPGCS